MRRMKPHQEFFFKHDRSSVFASYNGPNNNTEPLVHKYKLQIYTYTKYKMCRYMCLHCIDFIRLSHITNYIFLLLTHCDTTDGLYVNTSNNNRLNATPTSIACQEDHARTKSSFQPSRCKKCCLNCCYVWTHKRCATCPLGDIVIIYESIVPPLYLVIHHSTASGRSICGIPVSGGIDLVRFLYRKITKRQPDKTWCVSVLSLRVCVL